MGFLRRKAVTQHRTSVCYIYDRKHSSDGYYIALCSCRWMSEFFGAPDFPDSQAELQAASAALRHEPSADTEVGFPLDDPRPKRSR